MAEGSSRNGCDHVSPQNHSKSFSRNVSWNLSQAPVWPLEFPACCVICIYTQTLVCAGSISIWHHNQHEQHWKKSCWLWRFIANQLFCKVWLLNFVPIRSCLRLSPRVCCRPAKLTNCPWEKVLSHHHGFFTSFLLVMKWSTGCWFSNIESWGLKKVHKKQRKAQWLLRFPHPK